MVLETGAAAPASTPRLFSEYVSDDVDGIWCGAEQQSRKSSSGKFGRTGHRHAPFGERAVPA